MNRSAGSGSWPLGLVALCYVATFLWVPDGGFFINDNGLKFIQVDGLVRSSLSSLAIDWPGRALDPDLAYGPLTPGFMALADGELHAAYSPVFALLTAPLYAAFGLVGLYLLPLAGGLLALVAVRDLAGEVAPAAHAARVQTLAVLAAGLATPMWFYSLTFWEHAPAVACSCFSVLACVRYRARPTARLAVATATFAALACWFRPDAYLFAGIVLFAAGLAAPDRLRAALSLGGAFALVMSPVWLLHQVAFGNPLGPHVATQIEEIDLAEYLASRARTASNVLARAHASAAFTAVAVAPFALVLLFRRALVGARLRVTVPIAAAAGVLAGLVVLVGHLSASRPMNWLMVSNGLFASAPICILALLHVARDERGDDASARARRLLLGVALAYALLFAVFVPEVNSRGIHWGNRFLLPTYPLFAVLASAVAVAWWDLGRVAPRAGKVALAVLLGVSLVLQVYSVVMLHDRKAFTQRLNDRVAASALETVVVDTWFLPVDLGRTFHDKSIFLVHGGERGAFRAFAQNAGIERALSIEKRGGPSGEGNGEVVDDGWLNFSPVVLREVRFIEPPLPLDPER